MANGASPEAQAGLWALLGIAGTLIFAGRFYLQWLVSERQKRSVIPIGFWYMSATGALILLVYSAIITSPVGALSYCFNLVIYSRNLVHIWRERGRLTPRLNHTVHGAVAIIVIASTTLAAYVWLQEYHQTKDLAPEVIRRTWFWIAVGVMGQGLFGCRFLVQWLVTEYKRRSVMPVAFWWLSLAASLLLLSSYLHRLEWILAFGVGVTIPIYIRNLILIRRSRIVPDPEDTAVAEGLNSGEITKT